MCSSTPAERIGVGPVRRAGISPSGCGCPRREPDVEEHLADEQRRIDAGMVLKRLADEGEPVVGVGFPAPVRGCRGKVAEAFLAFRELPFARCCSVTSRWTETQPPPASGVVVKATIRPLDMCQVWSIDPLEGSSRWTISVAVSIWPFGMMPSNT